MTAKNNFFRTAGLLAGALTLAANPLRAADADALPTFDENYIKVSAAGMDISGSRAAAQRRTQLPKVGAAGIEAFNVTRELSKVTTMQVDGQALPGAEDYLAQFRIQKNEVGSFEVGYKTFRTFYDGVGGFFPTNNAWVPLQKRALYIDRGKFYIDGTIALPKAPVFTFRYTNSTRDGRKDSTIWGDTSFTGIPNYSLSSLNSGSIARKFLPAYNQIDERRETIEGTVTHTFGKTTAMLSLVGTRIDNLNTRNVDRFVGELRPYPTIPANPPTIIAPELSNNPNVGFDTQGLKEDSWAITAKVESALSDTVSVFGGVSYRTSDGDISASRLITLTMRSSAGPISGIGGFASGGRPPYSYTTAGTVKLDTYVANAGVNLKPSKDLAVDVAVKAEDTSISSNNLATYISTFMNQSTGFVGTPLNDPAPNWSRVTQKGWSPEINARYTGINKVSLFGSVDYRSVPGDERHLDTHYGPGPAGSTIVAAAVGTKEEKEKEKYLNSKIGAVWAPSLQLNLRGELFSKDHENRFEGYGDSLGDLYVLDYDIVGVRITATLRPIANWSFLTRYTTQTGKAAVLTDVYAKGDAKDAKRHTISETVNWTPNNLVFVQGDVNVVFDSISTAYPKSGGLANDVLRNADNNYWTGNLLVGFVVDKVTNATIQGSYYKANNYEPSLAAATMPYGAGGREYSISCGVTRKFSDRWLGSAKLGYFDSRNDTAGGNSDFKGPLAYLSMQHAF